MKNRIETVDVVGDLVAQMDTTVKINAIVDNADGSYTISTCNTKYLRPCTFFDVDGVTYEVTDGVFTKDEILSWNGNSYITRIR